MTRSTRTTLWTAGLGLLALAGLGGHLAVLANGQKLFGSSDAVPWNILVAAYAFLAGTAAGISFFTSAGDLFGWKPAKAISRQATVASLTVLVAALLAIAADLGRPQAIMGFLSSPNLASPLWWMAMTYGAVLLLRVVKLWGYRTGKEASGKALAWIGLGLSLLAPAVLGTLFAVLQSRPFWFSPMTVLFVIVLALSLGAAAMMVTAILEGAQESTRFFGRFLAGLLVALGVVLVLKSLVADAGYAQIALSGQYAGLFWGLQVGLGMIVPVVILTTSAGNSAVGAVGAAGAALAGGLAGWFLQVVVGQGLAVLPFLQHQAYSVTMTEALMVAGVVGLAGFLYLVVSRYLLPTNRNPVMTGGDD